MTRRARVLWIVALGVLVLAIGERWFYDAAAKPALGRLMVSQFHLDEVATIDVIGEHRSFAFFPHQRIGDECSAFCFSTTIFGRVDHIYTLVDGGEEYAELLATCPPETACKPHDKVDAFVVPADRTLVDALLEKRKFYDECSVLAVMIYQGRLCRRVSRDDGETQSEIYFANLSVPIFDLKRVVGGDFVQSGPSLTLDTQSGTCLFGGFFHQESDAMRTKCAGVASDW